MKDIARKRGTIAPAQSHGLAIVVVHGIRAGVDVARHFPIKPGSEIIAFV